MRYFGDGEMATLAVMFGAFGAYAYQEPAIGSNYSLAFILP